MIDLSHCRIPPVGTKPYPHAHFKHQVEGIERIVANPFFFLQDEMGAGKTKQAIDAAQVLLAQGVINKVLVICPSAVRSVWFDPELGELKKHLWYGHPTKVIEYHAKVRLWEWEKPTVASPVWMITNFEFIASKNRKLQLLPFCTPQTLLIIDESSAIANYKSACTKACFEIRKKCGRILEMNGTPVGETPLDLFTQANILHPSILDCQYITHYKARYCEQKPILGTGGQVLKTKYGAKLQQVTGFKNLPDIQRRLAPYVIRRLKRDCIDLPPLLEPITYTVTLCEETWRIYTEMRDEMVVWLKSGAIATARQAAVKRMRLEQITSGLLGGIEDVRGVFNPESGLDELVEQQEWLSVRSISTEKQDFVFNLYKQLLKDDPSLKTFVWCRFRPELHRFMMAPQLSQHRVAIHGEQTNEQRHNALMHLDPRTAPSGSLLAAGTIGTGALGLNFTAVHTVINMSFSDSLLNYSQAAARFDRPGQTHSVSTFDIIAVGPKGQKTIDHAKVKARREKSDLATWTTSAWVEAIEGD